MFALNGEGGGGVDAMHVACWSCQSGSPERAHLNRRVINHANNSHFALHPITLRVTSIHYGPWKACTLRNRCTPCICCSGWCQAVYRFRVCILSLLLPPPPSSHLSLSCIVQTQSSSPTQPFVRSRNHTWALEKRCSMPSKEPW